MKRLLVALMGLSMLVQINAADAGVGAGRRAPSRRACLFIAALAVVSAASVATMAASAEVVHGRFTARQLALLDRHLPEFYEATILDRLLPELYEATINDMAEIKKLEAKLEAEQKGLRARARNQTAGHGGLRGGSVHSKYSQKTIYSGR